MVQARKEKRVKRAAYYKRNMLFYVMLLPVVVYYLVYCYAPMFGIVVAFQKYMPRRGILGSEWVGMRHFQILFSGVDFPMVMRNTVLISLYRLFWGFPTPIVLALLLNEMQNRHYKKICQTITYMPHFLSWVIVAGLVSIIFSLDGPINQLVSLLGREKKIFLADARVFRSILVGSGIWKDVGWGTLIYLAAIAGVEPELYESAVLDGAGRWKQTLHITLPSIQPTIVILLIMRTGGILNAGFEDVLLLQNTMVRNVAEVIDTYVYKVGIEQSNYSFATAVGLFKSVIGLAMVLFTNGIARKFGDNALL